MLSQAEVREFWEQGFVVVRAGQRERARDLRGALDRMLDNPAAEGHHGRRFGPSGLATSHRFGGLMHTNAVFADHANDKAILQLVGQLLGAAEAFRDVIISKPGRSGGQLGAHQDLAYWDVGHQNVLTVWFAMTEARNESGALWLIPGSHRTLIPHRTVVRGRPIPAFVTTGLRALISLTGTGDSPRDSKERFWAKQKEQFLEGVTRRWPSLAGLGDLQILDRDLPPAQPLLVTAEPGDMVLFHGLTIHGSNANQADFRRDAYLVTYVARNDDHP